MNFMNSLGDGWTIYLWLVAGGMILIACAYWMRWAAKNGQFNEDIKYLVFTEADRPKMKPAEYAKSREVLKEQEELRVKFLEQQAQSQIKSK
ncbi:MAG: hypothetical protein G3I11_00340 [Ferrovum sp.]|nr:hypothetical protein [Ferrovum sp.]